jgi:hypothetical protein
VRVGDAAAVGAKESCLCAGDALLMMWSDGEAEQPETTPPSEPLPRLHASQCGRADDVTPFIKPSVRSLVPSDAVALRR